MFFKSKKLLTIGGDSKTVKGQSQSVLTGILYMAPYNISGFQVCPKASEGCKLACLYTAGRGVYARTQQARIDKTRYFFNERAAFLSTLVENVAKLERKAAKRGMIPAVRLNGTSDLPWEKFKVLRNGVVFRNIMEAFPNVQFYDYTKILGRADALKLANYHLTFSLAENNDAEAKDAISQGYKVAVVMDTRRKEVKPKAWGGYKVIDGDKDDVRFMDSKAGTIIALSAKGKARYDILGFVRSKDGTFKTV